MVVSPCLRKLRLLSLALLLTGLSAGCGGTAPRPAVEEIKPAAERFPLRLGDRVVFARVAALPAEMAHGLMEETRLAADEGMLFVYLRPQEMSFWMRNTPLPLDLGYFTPEGELVEIYPLHPFDETLVRSRSQRLQFALEVNRGWFRQQGIRPGAQLNLEDVRAALKARGFDPARFGLASRP